MPVNAHVSALQCSTMTTRTAFRFAHGLAVGPWIEHGVGTRMRRATRVERGFSPC